MTRRLCLVTGATAGIGAAFAEVFAARGYDLAITGRRAERLDALAETLRRRHGIEAMTLPADLADPDAPARLAAELVAWGRPVDALVNNAGYGLRGAFADGAWPAHQAMLQVLVGAVAALTHAFLPAMVERRFGRVVNVASVMGLIPGAPGSAIYAASKAFVVKFSEALHLENRETGVHVTALCPGLTRSEFHDVAGMGEDIGRAPGWAWMEAQEVAEAGYEAVEANRPICVPGTQNKALTAAAKLLPTEWGLALTDRQVRGRR